MPDVPEVTVVVPAYNAARTIGAAVDSVLNQTFEDHELLVIDDGSVDSTGEVIAARRDTRLTYVRTENQGVSRARNAGLSIAVGRFIAFLDADDAWYETK